MIILWSDLHLSNKLPFAKPVKGLKTDRLIELETVCNQIIQTIQDTNSISIFGGDLLDSKTYDNTTLNSLFNILNNLKSCNTAYFLAGNHDFETKDKIHSNFMFLEEIYDNSNFVFIKDKTVIYREDKDLVLAFVPYSYDNKLLYQDIYDVTKETRSKYNNAYCKLLILHNELKEFKNHYGYIEEDSVSLTDIEHINIFDYVFAGHMHKGMVIDNIICMGAVIQKDFNSAGVNTYYYYLQEDGSVRKIKTNKFYTNFAVCYNEDDIRTINNSKYKYYLDIKNPELETQDIADNTIVKKAVVIEDDILKDTNYLYWEDVLLNNLDKELVEKHNIIKRSLENGKAK